MTGKELLNFLNSLDNEELNSNVFIIGLSSNDKFDILDGNYISKSTAVSSGIYITIDD